MDKIWDRNPSKSKVIGRCGGMKKTNDHAERQKSNAKKIPYLTYQKHTSNLISSATFQYLRHGLRLL